MISLRWLSLVFASSLLLTTSGRAGTFDSPFADSTICGAGDVAGSLATVDAFVLSPHCATLCKKTESDCKAFVRKIAACYVSFFGTAAQFALRNCAEGSDPVTVKACKLSTAATLRGIKEGIALERGGAFADCEAWSAACQAVCAAP
jgi:hypothetical protein